MILITGANGNLGRRLMEELIPDRPVRAVVRSERAAGMITTPGVEVRVLDYLDEPALTEAARGCSHIVHLVGIIKETASSSFRTAHEETSAVIARVGAATGVRRIIYLSILGAAVDSPNPCLASKGRAEQILLGGAQPALIIRVPMVLGEGDYASRALAHRAAASFSIQLRAASLEQPIYAGDVTTAIMTGITASHDTSLVLDLAGPESVTRRVLTRRAAQVMGRSGPRILSLPLTVGMAAAWLLEAVSSNPPVSRAMLGVLDHDDRIDPGPALSMLGLELTPLNEALRHCLVQ